MSHPTARPVLGLALAAITVLGLVPLAAANPTEQAHASAATDQVKGREFRFTLATKSAARPGTVTFTFTNVGSIAHDFSIAGKTTPLVAPGHTAKLVVRFRKTGRFSYLCTVPGHAAAGMRGVFTVR